jgi:hypothetical protein
VSRWVPGDLAVPPINDTAHTITRIDPDETTPDDGTYWPWTACDRKVEDGWTAASGHRECAVCANTNADVTDEIPILPQVDLIDMQTFADVVAVTSTFLHQMADNISDVAIAPDELHDRLRGIIDDEHRKRAHT